ncbi:MAG TPA: hypothetical protein VI168_17910 [Croceibacterium sp.]
MIPLLLLIWVAGVFGLVLAVYAAALHPAVRAAAFWLFASSPMIGWAWLNAPFFLRDGVATVHDPYFGVVLFFAAGFTVVTYLAAALGRQCGLGRFP